MYTERRLIPDRPSLLAIKPIMAVVRQFQVEVVEELSKD